MTTFRKVQGDVNETIVPILNGIEDLTAVATLEAHVWRKSVDPEDLAATVLDADDRTIEVDLGDATGWLHDAALGQWFVEYELTFGDGTVLTWPSGAPDQIIVRPQGS